jgi:hypothetical protein
VRGVTAPRTDPDCTFGTIVQYDCAPVGDGSYVDNFVFTTAATQRVRFAMTSSVVNSYLWVRQGVRTAAIDDDSSIGTQNAAVSVVLPAGSWQVWANTRFGGEFGPYQLVSAAQTLDVESCQVIWAAPGIADAAQTLPATACTMPNDSALVSDVYWVFVGGGDTIRVRATAAGFAARVRIYVNDVLQSAGNATGAGQPAQASFTVPGGSYGAIAFGVSSSSGTDANGAYALTLSRGAVANLVSPGTAPAPARSGGQFRLRPAGAP